MRLPNKPSLSVLSRGLHAVPSGACLAQPGFSTAQPCVASAEIPPWVTPLPPCSAAPS